MSEAEQREAIREVLDESAFYAARGVRPPAQRVEAPQVGVAVARLAAATRHELLTFDDPSGCIGQGVPERMLRHAASCMHDAVARLPDVRQITSRHGLAQDEELGTIAWRQGGRARVIPAIPFRLGVLDRKVALLPLDLDVFYNGMLVVRDPSVVRALLRAHRRWWDAGDDPAAGRDPHAPPPHLVPVLACLNEGLSDRAGATRTGLSPRTYARRVAELLELLGTTHRFQAGALAARRGWF
ncbi:helix-turn-helix transcriptional regulator [Actinomadura hibisca]|uniref:helix-turn-helix transcriptional regulator n=1 Tax=Actinomadura hibisca TaxID=68565 RepID=UPI00082E6341|nr:hypothetical protein [Actinomadura hibisca]